MSSEHLLPEQPVPIIPPIVFHNHHDPRRLPKKKNLQHQDLGPAKCVKVKVTDLVFGVGLQERREVCLFP